MPGFALTEGPDVYFSTLRSNEPGVPTFQINMLGGNDQLYTLWPSSLRAYLGSGNDYAQFIFMYDLSVYGEAGNDTIFLKSFWSLSLDGGDGADRVSFTSNSSGPITATGGAGNDFFYGNGHDLTGTVSGGSGNDSFSGFGPYGGRNITLAGGSGNDTYYVDPLAPPTIVESAGGGTDTVILTSSAPYAKPANVETVLIASSPPPAPPTMLPSPIRGEGNLTGTSGADTIVGFGGNDTLSGFGSTDLLVGGAGNDTLYGGSGNDQLNGGDGADLLRGDTQRDELWGGAGPDTFIFKNGHFGGASPAACDVIHDFSALQGDKIRLDAVDANSNIDLNQAFAFIGTAAFGHVAGQLRYEQINGNTFIQGDVNGDAIADFWLRLDGLVTLSSNDFFL